MHHRAAPEVFLVYLQRWRDYMATVFMVRTPETCEHLRLHVRTLTGLFNAADSAVLKANGPLCCRSPMLAKVSNSALTSDPSTRARTFNDLISCPEVRCCFHSSLTVTVSISVRLLSWNGAPTLSLIFIGHDVYEPTSCSRDVH